MPLCATPQPGRPLPKGGLNYGVENATDNGAAVNINIPVG